MVAAEFWEQGDLERNVLDQQPIVRVLTPLVPPLHFTQPTSVFNLKLSHLPLLAHDGQKLCRTATQNAVRFHRLRVLLRV